MRHIKRGDMYLWPWTTGEVDVMIQKGDTLLVIEVNEPFSGLCCVLNLSTGRVLRRIFMSDLSDYGLTVFLGNTCDVGPK